MTASAREIYREYDQYGVVRVLDDGNRRILSFGDDDEQSCVLKTDVTDLQHEYTRAMLLALMFTEPRRVLTLGLGAGSLNTCLHNRFPASKQQVVELRPAVIEAARRFFQLPRSKRLVLHEMDAKAYLGAPETSGVDILFSDLYGSDGMDEMQLDPDFIERCAELIKADGWLVLNCWREHESSELPNLLSTWFTELLSVRTSDGNWVLFAGKQPSQLSNTQIKTRLKQLEKQLGFSLHPGFKRLQSLF
ncbi:spermidine synthase [Marinobacterium mangrovicola]|uniref:Spermidine synthase n=1 Tax=Marinobacterium mangrovicola TaxID=1476959 RepID=A0A4V2PED7_9GAMM|nr:spermidine synthase [Marinobacterium mangrovicola]TCK08596.1 hypothetical protein CLV83_0686 [Marinobacterium mangrovicola]